MWSFTQTYQAEEGEYLWMVTSKYSWFTKTMVAEGPLERTQDDKKHLVARKKHEETHWSKTFQMDCARVLKNSGSLSVCLLDIQGCLTNAHLLFCHFTSPARDVKL